MRYIDYFNTNVKQNKKEQTKSLISQYNWRREWDLSLQYTAYSSLTEDTLGLSAFFHCQVHIGFHQTPQGCATAVCLHVALRPMNWERTVHLPMPSTTPHTPGNVQFPIIPDFTPKDFHLRGSLKKHSKGKHSRLDYGIKADCTAACKHSARIPSPRESNKRCTAGTNVQLVWWSCAEREVNACSAYLFRSNIPSNANQLIAQMVPLNSISTHRYEPQVWLQSCLNEHTYKARCMRNNEAQDTVVNRNNKKRHARITDCRRRAEMRKETVAMGFGEQPTEHHTFSSVTIASPWHEFSMKKHINFAFLSIITYPKISNADFRNTISITDLELIHVLYVTKHDYYASAIQTAHS